MLLKSLSVKAYNVISHSGVLESDWGKRQFARAYFLYKRRLDPLYANLTRRRPELFRGGHILDVGANLGYMTSLFAKAADPGFKVYAFEPEPANYVTLVQTMRARGLSNKVVLVQAAVGKQDGEVELLRNPSSHAQHQVITPNFKAAMSDNAADLVKVDLVKVPMVSLDSFVAREQIHPLSFAKIRLLGYEPPVCQGMLEILETNPNLTIAIAYTPGLMKPLGYDPAELIDLFESRGYRFYAVNDDADLLPIAKPKSGIAELLASSTFLIKSQLPLPDPRVGTADSGRRDYLELLLSKRSLTA